MRQGMPASSVVRTQIILGSVQWVALVGDFRVQRTAKSSHPGGVPDDSGSVGDVFCDNRAHSDGCAFPNDERLVEGALLQNRSRSDVCMIPDVNVAIATNLGSKR